MSSRGSAVPKLLLAMIALLAAGSMFVQAASAAPTFRPKTDFATGQIPYSVTSADFNGDSKMDLATANLGSNNVSVLFGNGSSPDPGPDPGPDPAAKINQVKVKGPAKVKKGKKVTYKVKISNSGNAAATGVKLKVSGKGVKANKSIGNISATKTKVVKVKLKFKKPGKIKASFRVTSKNAGSKTVEKKITVSK